MWPIFSFLLVLRGMIFVWNLKLNNMGLNLLYFCCLIMTSFEFVYYSFETFYPPILMGLGEGDMLNIVLMFRFRVSWRFWCFMNSLCENKDYTCRWCSLFVGFKIRAMVSCYLHLIIFICCTKFGFLKLCCAKIESLKERDRPASVLRTKLKLLRHVKFSSKLELLVLHTISFRCNRDTA